MSDQIILAWDVDVSGTGFGVAQAHAALAAIPLYLDPATDPVLGGFFGLTVASDSTTEPTATTARRTLTLNMTSANAPTAPPPFPCHPITATPPTLPYPLRSTRALPGSFFVSTGSMSVPVSATQLPSLSVGDKIQFLAQQGVFYQIASTGVTSISLTAPYTGVSGNTPAFKEVPAPVTIAAIYSTSDLDTAGVATTPAIPAGVGARTVTVTYTDSTGATGRSATASLTGRRPAPVTAVTGNGVISAIENIFISSSGGFDNNVGQLTLVSLSSALPAILANRTPDDFRGKLTDEAQLLIENALAFLPMSYFSDANQQASAPQLAGDFILTTGQTSVQTTVDQTGALAAGNIIQFAEQLANYSPLQTQAVFYVIAEVTPKLIKLTTPFTGIDNTNTGTNQEGTNANRGTKGNLGTEVQNKRSGAFLIFLPPGAPPSNFELSGPLGQFVAPETASPPPNPPLAPTTVPLPAILSNLFARTIGLALAVPVTSQEIAFA